MATAELKGAAQFFDKTWSSRHSLGESQNAGSARTMLGKIIADSKGGQIRTVEMEVRQELLSTMADLSAARAKSTDKQFNADVAPVLRTLGKLIAQKDQTKFFKQVKDFKNQLFVLEQHNKALGKDLREKLDFDRAEHVLEDIVEEEKGGFFETNLGHDTKTAFIHLLGPGGPIIHTLLGLKKAYGNPAKMLWGKLKAIVDAREKALEAQADTSSVRIGMFRRFGNMLRKGFNKATLLNFLQSSGKGILKTLFSKRTLGVAVGAAGILGAMSHLRGHSQGEEAATGTASSLPPVASAPSDTGAVTPTQAGPQQGQDSNNQNLIDSATDTIKAAMGDFTDWFSDKWDGLASWFDKLSIAGDLKTAWNDLKDNSVTKSIRDMFAAVPNMMRSVFRTIYNVLPTPIQKGIDWALRLGGESLHFFVDLLRGEANADIDSDTENTTPDTAKTAPLPVASAQTVAPAPAGSPTAATSPSSNTQYPGLKITQNADVAGLQDAAKSPLLAMAQEYFARTGKTLQINTARRSSAEQMALYSDGKHKAAAPGTSMHEYGYAIDMHAADANTLAGMGLLQKYGFVRPVSGEPWHLEPASIQGIKSMIRRTPATQSNAPGGRDIKSSPAVSQTMPAPTTGRRSPKLSDVASSGGAAATPKGENYDRVPSVSKRVSRTITQDEVRGGPAEGTMAAKTSLNDLSFYIGDFAFLHLNFGMGDN